MAFAIENTEFVAVAITDFDAIIINLLQLDNYAGYIEIDTNPSIRKYTYEIREFVGESVSMSQFVEERVYVKDES